MNKTNIRIIAGIVVAIGIITFWPYLGNPIYRVPVNNNPIACTMDAKICPDGSAVGRVGPNCEFAQCPSVATKPTPRPTDTDSISNDLTLQFGQSGKIGGQNITLNKIIQDSRCPTDVLCISAGLVEVNVTLTEGSKSVNVNIKSNSAPYLFYNRNISIISVEPSQKSVDQISMSQYRVKFHSVSTSGI